MAQLKWIDKRLETSRANADRKKNKINHRILNFTFKSELGPLTQYHLPLGKQWRLTTATNRWENWPRTCNYPGLHKCDYGTGNRQ